MFVPGKTFKCSLMFGDKARGLKCASLGYAPTFLARLCWKGLPRRNTLAYLFHSYVRKDYLSELEYIWLFSNVKTLQLFTSLITTYTNIFSSIKVIKNTCTQIFTSTKVIKNFQLLKAWVMLKLFIVLVPMK